MNWLGQHHAWPSKNDRPAKITPEPPKPNIDFAAILR